MWYRLRQSGSDSETGCMCSACAAPAEVQQLPSMCAGFCSNRKTLCSSGPAPADTQALHPLLLLWVPSHLHQLFLSLIGLNPLEQDKDNIPLKVPSSKMAGGARLRPENFRMLDSEYSGPHHSRPLYPG